MMEKSRVGTVYIRTTVGGDATVNSHRLIQKDCQVGLDREPERITEELVQTLIHILTPRISILNKG
jgi:hypothetical protein